MVKIQYLSDIHLEKMLNIPKIKPISEYLLLAGDIGYPKTEIYKQFFSDIHRNYKKIFVIDGNHEWDKGTPLSPQDRFGGIKNVFHLENSYNDIFDNYIVLGSTLWTPCIQKKSNINQFSTIYIHNTLYYLYQNNYKVIVLTHHLPSFSLIAPKYKNRKNTKNFANNLDYIFSQKWAPVSWICGHSHSFVQNKINNTFCGINTFEQKKHAYFEI